MSLDTSSIIASLGKKPRILVIRRDNIGDLVCTTPAFTLLRQQFPDAYIAALVNSYNASVLTHNTDIDKVFSYTKGKHTGGLSAKLSAWTNKLKMLHSLRKLRFDLAIVASTIPTASWIRLAKWSGARHILSAPTGIKSIDRLISISVLRNTDSKPKHMTEQIVELLAPLGINASPPQLVLKHQIVSTHSTNVHKPLCIGIHISARKPRQRWPVPNFVALIQQLHRETNCTFKLFWAPGKATNSQHPGDDEKAEEIVKATLTVPLLPVATHSLNELIDGLATVDFLICSDGGAMHLAAALKKPIICFFGNSDPNTWKPWKVPHHVLQPASENVEDINAEQALTATLKLLRGNNLLENRDYT